MFAYFSLSIDQTTQRFGNWFCFHHQAKLKKPTLLIHCIVSITPQFSWPSRLMTARLEMSAGSRLGVEGYAVVFIEHLSTPAHTVRTHSALHSWRLLAWFAVRMLSKITPPPPPPPLSSTYFSRLTVALVLLILCFDLMTEANRASETTCFLKICSLSIQNTLHLR
jgi:hypothetical protein